MSVSTLQVSWPTEESLQPLDRAFGKAYEELEGVVHDLKQATGVYAADGLWPEPLPSFETVGIVWVLLDNLRSEISQFEDRARDIERLLAEVDTIRRDGPLSVAREGESDA